MASQRLTVRLVLLHLLSALIVTGSEICFRVVDCSSEEQPDSSHFPSINVAETLYRIANYEIPTCEDSRGRELRGAGFLPLTMHGVVVEMSVVKFGSKSHAQSLSRLVFEPDGDVELATEEQWHAWLKTKTNEYPRLVEQMSLELGRFLELIFSPTIDSGQRLVEFIDISHIQPLDPLQKFEQDKFAGELKRIIKRVGSSDGLEVRFESNNGVAGATSIYLSSQMFLNRTFGPADPESIQVVICTVVDEFCPDSTQFSRYEVNDGEIVLWYFSPESEQRKKVDGCIRRFGRVAHAQLDFATKSSGMECQTTTAAQDDERVGSYDVTIYTHINSADSNVENEISDSCYSGAPVGSPHQLRIRSTGSDNRSRLPKPKEGALLAGTSRFEVITRRFEMNNQQPTSTESNYAPIYALLVCK